MGINEAARGFEAYIMCGVLAAEGEASMPRLRLALQLAISSRATPLQNAQRRFR
jgi:hypothetical protein